MRVRAGQLNRVSLHRDLLLASSQREGVHWVASRVVVLRTQSHCSPNVAFMQAVLNDSVLQRRTHREWSSDSLAVLLVRDLV